MANITVSANVDTMLQSANNAAIRSNIGATTLTDLEGSDINFSGAIECSNELSVSGDLTTTGDVNFSGSSKFRLPNVATSGVSSPQNGMMIYDTSDDTPKVYVDGGWYDMI